MPSTFRITKDGVSGSFTGSLLGTASFAISTSQAVSSSYAISASRAVSASYIISAPYVTSASYYSTGKEIQFFNQAGTKVASIDATDFIKDGMLSSASVSGGYLVLTFNTDAGQEPISMSLTQIFDPANYYTKTDINAWTGSWNSAGSWVADNSGAVASNTSARHTHSNKALLDSIDDTAVNSWDDAADYAHTHSNMSVLNGITAAKTASWDTVAATASQAYQDATKALATASVAQAQAESASYWKTEASKSAALAAASASAVAAYVSSTSNSAVEAADYALDASGSMEDARFYSSQAATNATLTSTYAVQASASAATAASYATAASASSGVVYQKAQEASASAASAAGSATTATTQATTATNAATRAGASASVAANWAASASTYSSNASTYATRAQQSASAAATSATNASASAALMYKNVGSARNPVYMSASVGPVACTGYTVTAAQTASWDGKWTYNAATIQAVKVNSASRADSAASADKLSNLTVNSSTSTPCNSATSSAGYIGYYGSNGGPATTLPFGAADGAFFAQNYSTVWGVQIAADYRTGQLASRGHNNGTWTAWKRVALWDYVTGATSGTVTLAAGRFTNCGTVAGTLTFATGGAATEIYAGQFTLAGTARTITWPAGIKWVEGNPDTSKLNCTYEFSICNGVGVLARTA